MADAQVNGDHPLAGAFGDFHLLPDLLAAVARRERLSDAWPKLLKSVGCSLDHVEDGDQPDGVDSVYAWMATDVGKLARRLHLIEVVRTDEGADLIRGLTDAGRMLAEVAERPLDGRTAADAETVRTMLERQVRAFHLSRDGVPVIDLLLEGAGALAETSHVWAGYCPGLLLAEFDALAHEATAEDGDARGLLGNLVHNRDYAMHAHGMPSPDVAPVENLLAHADAVTRFYLDDLEYDQRSDATITGLRATAMLLECAGLLAQGAPVGPVQYLTSPA